MVNPPLTTIRIGHHAMGVQAAQLVLRRLRENEDGQVEIRLKPELVVRHSTTVPRRS
jgi:LacI family transcriptional regulator